MPLKAEALITGVVAGMRLSCAHDKTDTMNLTHQGRKLCNT
jgi:hypothetical protein